MSRFTDALGTINSYFKIGLSGVRLKNSSGNLLVRNTGDSADAAVTASAVNISGESLVINSDAAGSSADWTYTLSRPTSGMTAAVTLTLPTSAGSANQSAVTNGSGTLSFADRVSSVAMTVPSILSVSGSPITTSGTLAVTLATQTANTVLAGATSGGAAAPSFRALVAADIPSLAASILTSGTVDTARLGSGSASSSTFLRGDQSWAAPTAANVSGLNARIYGMSIIFGR